MKLTNYIKDAILESILKDMPEPINYHEQIQGIVWNDSLSQLPMELQNAISANKDIKNHLGVKSMRIAGCGSMYLRSYAHYIPSKETEKKVTRLNILNDEQNEKRGEIRNNLRAIIYACANSKQFADNYPEFAGYLPKEEQPIRNLPAVDLINRLKQSGWNQKQKV